MQKRVSDAPNTVSAAPKSVRVAQNSVPGVPNTVPAVQKSLRIVPKSVSAAPKSVSAAPKSVFSASQSASAVPKSASAPSQSVRGSSCRLRALPNKALQRTEAGGGAFSVFHVFLRQPPSLSLSPLGRSSPVYQYHLCHQEIALASLFVLLACCCSSSASTPLFPGFFFCSSPFITRESLRGRFSSAACLPPLSASTCCAVPRPWFASVTLPTLLYRVRSLTTRSSEQAPAVGLPLYPTFDFAGACR